MARMKRVPSRAPWTFAAVAAVALAAWATWTLVVRPDTGPVSDDTPRAGADERSKSTVRSSDPIRADTTPERSTPRSPTIVPSDDRAERDAQPLMGDSLDPQRLRKARRAFDEAMEELDELEDPTPQRISEIYLKGHTAIERMEDEARGDPEAEAAVKRDLERLRTKVKELAGESSP